MSWLQQAIDILIAKPICGYYGDSTPSVEPTALAAAGLLAAGRNSEAATALDWLVRVQSADGSLGVDAETHQPCWPTGWAALAWNMAAQNKKLGKRQWGESARRAVEWTLSVHGLPVERKTEDSKIFGHNTQLQGWPWVVGTHSWVEPTAIALLALRSAELADHSRAREAVKLLLDRQLPDGGWNYGNTTVFGHVLRPHVEATGMALAALAGEPDVGAKVERSLDWLRRTISPRTTTASLCYAIWGLTAHGRLPEQAAAWLEAAYQRTKARDASPYHIALLVLAARKADAHGTQP
jgi:hypothetical protein